MAFFGRSVSNRALLIFLTVLSVDSFADEKSVVKNSEVRELTAYVTQPRGRRLPRINFELGEIDAGQDLRLSVKVFNTLDEPISFSDIRATCHCTELSPTRGKIESGKSIVLSMKFKAPGTPRSTGGGGTFRLLDPSGSELVDASFVYKMSRYFGFEGQVVRMEIANGEREVEVSLPFVAGEKVNVEKLSVTLEGIEAEHTLVVDTSRRKVLGDVILPRDYESETVFAKIIVTEATSGVSKSTPVVFSFHDRLSVVPRLLRFTRDAKGKGYEATIYASLEGEPDTPSLYCEANVEGNAIRSVASKVGKNTHEIKLLMSKSLATKISENLSEKSKASPNPLDNRISLEFKTSKKSFRRSFPFLIRFEE